MEEQKIVPNTNVPAELAQSWHIPRPTLARSSHSSQGSTSGSTNSTQSARSGSLLLTAANLAQIAKTEPPTPNSQAASAIATRNENIRYYLETSVNQKNLNLLNDSKTSGELKESADADNVSIASSMHFTVVNVNSRPPVRTRSCCKKHQISVLIITMSVIFSIGIIGAIFLLEMRARRQLPY